MSLYSNGPSLHGLQGSVQASDGGFDMEASGVPDMNMLGGNGLMNGLDLDMDLSMDLEMEPGQDAQNFQPVPSQFQTQTSSSSSQAPEQNMAQSTSDGTNASQSNQRMQQQQQDSEASMTGAGAGPLPTGFGMPAPMSSSMVTEFTKRRNWPQRVIEELKDFLHILTPDGRIIYVSPSCKAITGHEPQSIVGNFIGEYVHPDDSGIFMREFNESIASGNSLRFFYRFKKEDGSYIIFECDGHPHTSPEPPPMVSNDKLAFSTTGICVGFFMMARLYPTKNAALLDSFLEHKMENERLLRRITDLKREEAEEHAEQDKLTRRPISSKTSATPLEHQLGHPSDAVSETRTPEPNHQGMPPPAKPTISNTALTRQNLDSALSTQKPDSIADKMSRYENSATHLESIEMLTGLRYQDGERSHGISTGDTSPALIRGDAGIAILLDRDREGPKKDKKKAKVADEYVCADCGTLDSPEWRKGPKGPKTLCNACGLRWAKKEKKKPRTSYDGSTNSPGGGVQIPRVETGPAAIAPHMGGVGGHIPGSGMDHTPNRVPLAMQMGDGSSRSAPVLLPREALPEIKVEGNDKNLANTYRGTDAGKELEPGQPTGPHK